MSDEEVKRSPQVSAAVQPLPHHDSPPSGSNSGFLDRKQDILGESKVLAGDSVSDMAAGHGAADTSIITGENELASTTMAEQTLVDGVNSGDVETRTHRKGPSSSTVSLTKTQQTHRRDGSRATTGLNQPATWDPLQKEETVDNDKTQVLDNTVVMEDGDDVVDSNGKVLYPDNEAKPTPIPSRRTSHLRLDIKPPSPMPWEQIDPPLSNNDSAGGTRQLIPKSSYYFGPPPPDSAYGTHPVGQIGVHHPREVLRVERDYTGGEVIQFAPIYPLELEGRITPTSFLNAINAINELLISAHSLRHSVFDNTLAIFSLQISKLFVKSHFEKEMDRLHNLINDLNTETFNPVGLNILWPRNVAFLYLEIEYY
ncbi:hypothetical protein CPC08DRAFT_490556 [Agrocybe pediades]|nr:hypothetical protein CPC08DRAFT_490556 [Agrocybe pediades]